jgi:hypothetical protein
LIDHLIRLSAAAASADKRNDAEGAAVVAPILDLEIRPGAVAQGILDGSREKIALFGDVADVNLAVIRSGFGQHLRDQRLVRIAHHQRYSGQPGQLGWGSLRVAPCDENEGIGMGAVDAADGLANLIVGVGGDGAGVEDHYIRVGDGSGRFETLGGESRFEGCSVGLGGPATKSF